MADSSQVSISYKEEGTFGTDPAGNYQGLRFTGEGLKQDTSVTNSSEIRDDRQLSTVKRTDLSASGNIDFELSYGTYDDFFEAGLQSGGWAIQFTTDAAVNDCTFTTSANTLKRDADDWDAANGDLVKISGSVEAANNGIAKVVSGGGTDTLTIAGLDFTTSENDDGVTVTTPYAIQNASEARFFSIERGYTDISKYAQYRGMMVDGFSVDASVGSIISGSIDFLGKNEVSAATTAGTIVDPPTTDVMNTIDDVQSIVEGTGSLAQVTGWGFSVRNNLRGRTEIGTEGLISVGSGTIEVTGTLSMYFADATIMDKYLNQTFSSLILLATDAAGNSYAFDFPQVRYTSGLRVAGGQNQDVMAEMGWSAILDPTELKTVTIGRWAA